MTTGRPRRRWLLVVLSLLAIPISLVHGAGSSAFDAGTHESQLFADMNQDRTSNGVPSVTYNSQLANLARAGQFRTCGPARNGRSQDMIDNNYFDHVIVNCGNRMVFDVMTDLHIYYREAGENIGWTTAGDATSAADIESRFMASPDHRANILNSHFTQAGMGAAVGTAADTCCSGSSETMYTQIFMLPPASQPPPPPPPPPATSTPRATGGGPSPVPTEPQPTAAPVVRNSPVPTIALSPASAPTQNLPPSPSPLPSGIELSEPASGLAGAGTEVRPGLVELLVESVLRAFLNL